MKIFKQRYGKLTEADAQAFAALFIKAGYTVAVRQEKIPTGTGTEAKGWVILLTGDDGQ